MIGRRVILGTAASALVVGDGVWFYQRCVAPDAIVTYVGLDSLEVTVPVKMSAPTLRNGKWSSDPMAALNPSEADSRGATSRPLAFVGLQPDGNYRQAIKVIRDLKARHICNVAIRESGRGESGIFDFPSGPDHALTMPAIILCGSAIGDAGFIGNLPADGPIHAG